MVSGGVKFQLDSFVADQNSSKTFTKIKKDITGKMRRGVLILKYQSPWYKNLYFVPLFVCFKRKTIGHWEIEEEQ